MAATRSLQAHSRSARPGSIASRNAACQAGGAVLNALTARPMRESVGARDPARVVALVPRESSDREAPLHVHCASSQARPDDARA